MTGFPEDAQSGLILEKHGITPKMLWYNTQLTAGHNYGHGPGPSGELLLTGCLFEWGLGYPKAIYEEYYKHAVPIARLTLPPSVNAACYHVTHYAKQSKDHRHRPCLCTVTP